MWKNGIGLFSLHLLSKKITSMSLFNNNKKGDKQGNKNQKNAASNSKFIVKPTKGANIAKKPIKTGGSRGS